jgi:septal ring factor EnvC (AmiA/AmiB activator)
MSQSHNLSDYTEFLPKKDRRTPLPITNLPVNAISEENDPTLEIRTLIEQLQQTARDARAKVRAAEQERDDMARQLARTEQQVEALRETERELRSHFVEVTSIIQERGAGGSRTPGPGARRGDAQERNRRARTERCAAPAGRGGAAAPGGRAEIRDLSAGQ